MCGLIEANLDLCGIPEEETDIHNTSAVDFLHQAVARQMKRWDIVFFDPPYQENYHRVLEFLGTHTLELLSTDGLIVIEHYYKNQLDETFGKLGRGRILKQGDSSLTFYTF